MLTHLVIKNYALIRHLEMSPSHHLNVITGETGAGKSILIGAIGLLLGDRADSKALWDSNEKCVTEGTFDIAAYSLKKLFEKEDLDYSDTTVLRREISPGGKSRAFINDTPVTLDVMRKIGARLMDIHSQHETLQLADKTFQLGLIDSFAGNEKLLNNYSEAWRQYVSSKRKYEDLLKESSALKQESDFINFQLQELVKANLVEGEQEKLESDLKILENTETIKSHLNGILEGLTQSEYSVVNAITKIRSHLNNLSEYSENFKKLFERIESLRIELNDIAAEVGKEEEATEFDPQGAEQVKERLSLLYHLMQKHRTSTVSDLLTLQASLQERSTKTANLDHLLEDAKNDTENNFRTVSKIAGDLSQARHKTFPLLTKQLLNLLKNLGIPEASITIDHSKTEPSSIGIDQIEFLFSANKGMAPRPLEQVASGGEFARLMFCLKYIMAEKTSLPTLLLDEIDTGISGEIAIKMSKMMEEMALRHQLIVITHLPQIAAKGNTHYFVYKDNSASKTVSNIKNLSDRERIQEIAQMIGGANPSASALKNAREMIEN